MTRTNFRTRIKLKTNLVGFEKTLQNSIRGGGSDSFKFATFEVLEKVRDEVVKKYEEGVRTRSKGALKSALSRIFVTSSGSEITGYIVRTSDLPPYWRFQEFGTKASTRIQPYRYIPNRGFVAIKKDLLPQTANFSYKAQMISGIGLVKYISINNPGIQARGFIAAGKLMLDTKGAFMFQQRLSKLFQNLVLEHTKKYKL